MANGEKKGFIRAFLDFFVLFSGISTAANLGRTQGRRPNTRGIFLFRRRRSRNHDALAAPTTDIDEAPRN
jgi:hypothetical protein